MEGCKPLHEPNAYIPRRGGLILAVVATDRRRRHRRRDTYRAVSVGQIDVVGRGAAHVARCKLGGKALLHGLGPAVPHRLLVALGEGGRGGEGEGEGGGKLVLAAAVVSKGMKLRGRSLGHSWRYARDLNSTDLNSTGLNSPTVCPPCCSCSPPPLGTTSSQTCNGSRPSARP